MSKYKHKVNLIIRKIQHGDKSRVNELYALTVNNLKIIALRYAFDKNDYEDILMEAYMRIFKYINTADTEQDGYNWMCKIVQNVAYDINKGNVLTLSLEEISLTAVVGDFRNQIEQKDEIVREICKLSDYEQRLFYLRFYECKSYSEIAEIVKSKKSTVHKQIKAILKKLDKKFD